MTEIVWGPEIAVDGKRPEWLADDDTLDVEANGYGWYADRAGIGVKQEMVRWEHTINIRLPADHPHYAELSGNSGQLDWSKPIEAVHEDGRVEVVRLADDKIQPDCDGDYTLQTGSLNGYDVYHSDGSSWSDGPWRIRNVAQAPKTTRTAPSGGGVGPEMVQSAFELLRQIAGCPIEGQQLYDVVPRARAIVSLLPEPVDPDEAIAAEMALAGEGDFVTPYPPERRKRLQSQLLAAIKRGRALENEAGR